MRLLMYGIPFELFPFSISICQLSGREVLSCFQSVFSSALAPHNFHGNTLRRFDTMLDVGSYVHGRPSYPHRHLFKAMQGGWCHWYIAAACFLCAHVRPAFFAGALP